MAFLRSRNAALTAKIESVEGTFAAPNTTTDGVLVEGLSISLDPQNVNTDEVTGSLDGRGPIPGGMQCKVGFDVWLKGSGTPGTPAEWGKLMKACGWAETATVTSLSGTTFSISGTDKLNDSANGLAVFTVGTEIFLAGFANAANNGAFRVTTSAAGQLTLTKVDGAAPAMVAETAGATITLLRGVVGTAATAGTTTGFTGQAPFSATAQLYRGMPVLVGGNPATPAYSFITDWTAARVATLTDLFGSALSGSSIVSIPANVLYAPSSSVIPSVSLEIYLDGLRYRFAGARGDVSLEFTAAGACKAKFSFDGLYDSKVDAAMIAPSYDGTRPGTWRNSKMLVNRVATALRTLSYNSGNQMTFPPDPNVAEGFGVPQITRRNSAGQMDPFETLVATRDIMGAFRAGTEQIVHARVTGGTAANAGQRLGLTVPSAFYTGQQPGDSSGLATVTVPFFPRGQDSGAFLCIY